MNILKRTFSHIAATLAVGLLFLPFVTFAAPSSFKGLVVVFLDVINDLIRLVLVLALLFFIFNIFKLLFAGPNEDKRTEAKAFMIYGIIALFVMVSVWGLVNILTSTIFGGAFRVPQLR